MGSASGGSKVHPPSRPMKREPHLLPPQSSNPRIDQNPNPNLGAESPMPDAEAGSSSASVNGAEEDEALRGAAILSLEEVLRRRSRRSRQLLRCYQRQYWALMEEMRAKHRDYYWEYGNSPLEEGGGGMAEENGGAAVFAAAREESGESGRPCGLGLGIRKGGKGACGRGERLRCTFAGCKSYAMPLTRYCHPHILLDGQQTLYKACSFVIKSAQSGQIICGKPVLRATVPSLCPAHFKKAEKHVSQALKKAGLNISSSGRPAPKFHVIVAEYVHQIQAKRREALSGIRENGAE